MNKIERNFEDRIYKGLSWEIKNPKANIILIEGMEEHTSRYDSFATFFNNNGYSIFSFDLPGQGENVKEDLSNRGVWEKNAYLNYINFVHDFVLSLTKDIPIYLFTHSMGSFIAQGYITIYPNDFKKVALSGAGFKNKGTGIVLPFAKLFIKDKNRNDEAKLLHKIMFGSFNKRIKNPRTDFDWLSYNEDNVNKYIDDPLCGYGERKGFCLEFLSYFKTMYLKEGINNINKKTSFLIVTGDEDPVTNYTKYSFQMRDFYKSIGIEDVNVIVYKHCRHEIHNECESIRNQELLDLLNFFNK